MNKEFEILNRKLDMIFDEIIWLRKDVECEKSMRERKELESELKYCQSRLEDRKESLRFICENYDATRNSFRFIERDYHSPVEQETKQVEAL